MISILKKLATMIGVGLVLGLWTLGAECPEGIAEKVGYKLGSAFVAGADILAKAHIRRFVDCSETSTDVGVQEYCNDRRASGVIREINKAIADGCLQKKSNYGEGYDRYFFSTLKKGLASPEPLVRWHVLGAIYGVCEEPKILSDAGAKGCGEEVEGACVEILTKDNDPMNRQLALEVLGAGYAGAKSRRCLEVIGANAADKSERCPRIVSSEKGGDEEVLKDLEEGYRAGKYACERELANEALSIHDVSGKKRQ